MKQEVKITKKENDAYKRVTLGAILVGFVIAMAFIFLLSDMIIEGILILLAFSLAMQFFMFGWIFRLRYHFLGPLTKYKKDDNEDMKLDDVD